MPTDQAEQPGLEGRIAQVLHQYWGFDSLRPLQGDAVRAALSGRDSLVVVPTGGGKSLCYQVPPLIAGRTDVVVSPLISLMKDQVDALTASGYPAAALHSGLTPAERRDIEERLWRKEYRLLYVAPERLSSAWFLNAVKKLDVNCFAIDEAHCISHWGHDFRPEYRRLAMLREQFPGASMHAFTATATPRVRDDIIQQLGLRDPAVLVGVFDRPNLIYRIVPQSDVQAQCVEALKRHDGEAAIVYCLSRRDTESLAAHLRDKGFRAAHYHAGMEPNDRRKTQDRFSSEDLDVVVATVAFGMGIDRSNVRCVVHASLPKSVEHYQQETGRAGRDGLEAECVLLYTGADVMRWEGLIARSAEEAEDPAEQVRVQADLLKQMQKLCSIVECRHKRLTEYFGQAYDKPNCGACDVCLGDVEGVEDASVLAQKILSCIARTDQRFGVGHIVDVLAGAKTENIQRYGHDKLSTYGLIPDIPRKQLTSLVYQLVDQDVLSRVGDEYPILKLNEESIKVMRGQRQVRLIQTKRKLLAKMRRGAEDSWEGVDKGLFEEMRKLRHGLAVERGVPAYTVMHDRTLRELARIRPGSIENIEHIYGLGSRKIADIGPLLVDTIRDFCVEGGAAMDVGLRSSKRPSNAGPGAPVSRSQSHTAALKMFAEGGSIEEVMRATGRARSTTVSYLAEYLRSDPDADVEKWIAPEIFHRVNRAADTLGDDRLKPIFDHLAGAVTYDDIKIALARRYDPGLNGG
ncbi:MAG: DNA helicase RecQ [Planctomycetes bacterium]|nr:DNA helicase RecQ [Planctomycetota bacterium]